MKVMKVGASWCSPCKAMEPILSQIEIEHGITIERIDIDASPEVKEKYGIRTIPTIIVEDSNGYELLAGMSMKGSLEKFLTENGVI